MKIWHIKTIVATIVSVILFILLMVIILWQQGIIKPTKDSGDLSQFLDLTEDEFLNVFHLPEIKDPEEKKKRVQTLKEHQQAVLQNNQLYLAMKRTWFEGINEFSDIPDDEFIATHTGLIENPDQFNNETQPVLEESVMSNLPASYDSVSLGHVSPVKNQGGCGIMLRNGKYWPRQKYTGTMPGVFCCLIIIALQICFCWKDRWYHLFAW